MLNSSHWDLATKGLGLRDSATRASDANTRWGLSGVATRGTNQMLSLLNAGYSRHPDERRLHLSYSGESLKCAPAERKTPWDIHNTPSLEEALLITGSLAARCHTDIYNYNPPAEFVCGSLIKFPELRIRAGAFCDFIKAGQSTGLHLFSLHRTLSPCFL